MGGITFFIHPLFFLFGLYFALTGRIFIFLTYTFSAVIHELGHSIKANSFGYEINRITLMPFGAVAVGNIDGLKPLDEIKIAIAGPLTNLFIAIFFVAVWWIYPEIYVFTDIIVEANLVLALINFIPAYPLDGGRVLSSLLAVKLGDEKSVKICKALGIALGIVLFALFIFSIFNEINVSILFFSLFVMFEVFGKKRQSEYIKICSFMTEEKLLRGLTYKKQALSVNATVKKLIKVLDGEAVNEIVVMDGDNVVTTLSQARIEKIITEGDIYSPIKRYLKNP